MYLYLVRQLNAYKIGITGNPHKRMQALKNNALFDIELLGMWRTDDARALEKHLHTQFADERIKGEWFELDAEDVAEVKRIADAACYDDLVDRLHENVFSHFGLPKEKLHNELSKFFS